MNEIQNAIAATSSQKNRHVVSLDEFKGVKLFSIRQWYVDKATSEWRPTTKGISLSEEKFNFVLRAIKDHEDEIRQWLQDDNSTHAKVWQEHQKQRVYGNQAMFKRRFYEVNKEAWKSPEFFRVEAEGGKDRLVLNIEHPLIALLLELTSTNQESPSSLTALSHLFEILLLSFARTQRLFNEGQMLDQESFFEIVMSNWGLLAQRYFDEATRRE